jgi:FkbM family methyltransferase
LQKGSGVLVTSSDSHAGAGAPLDTSKFGPGNPKSQQMVRDLAALYERLASGTLGPGDTVPLDVSKAEGKPKYLQNGLKSGLIDQQDALVFKHLTADMGVILDVGAHWGYMAMSMLNVGTPCPVVSFEAIPYNLKCLQTLKAASSRYDFVIGAVSDTVGTVTLYNPVVNGTPMSGVNSINGETLGLWWVPSTVEMVEKYHRYKWMIRARSLLSKTPAKFQLGVYTIEARPLDVILATHTFRFPVDRVAALKIDVEGHERAVLDGARKTIERDRPLMIVEGGSNEAVTTYMSAAGYSMVQRNNDHLEPLSAHALVANEFFVHASRMEQYQSIGVLRQ